MRARKETKVRARTRQFLPGKICIRRRARRRMCSVPPVTNFKAREALSACLKWASVHPGKMPGTLRPEGLTTMTSVNTNYGALVALQSLNQTTRELSEVQNRVN